MITIEPGADIGPAVLRVPKRRRQLARGRPSSPRIGVLEHRRVLHHDRRLQLERLALVHPGLERIERPQGRVEPERERGALRADRWRW